MLGQVRWVLEGGVSHTFTYLNAKVVTKMLPLFILSSHWFTFGLTQKGHIVILRIFLF